MRSSSVLDHTLGRALPHKAKEVAGNTTHLNFFSTLSNAIAAMVPVNMFEGLMAAIAQTTMYLHGAISHLLRHLWRHDLNHADKRSCGRHTLRIHNMRRMKG